MGHPAKEVLWGPPTAAEEQQANEKRVRDVLLAESAARLQKLASRIRVARRQFRQTGEGLERLQSLEAERHTLHLEHWYGPLGVFAVRGRFIAAR